MSKTLITLFVLMLPFITLSQNLQNDNIEDNVETKSLINETKKLDDDGMGSLNFGFCNNGVENPTTTLNAALTQGKNFKVCTVRLNNSSEDITISAKLTKAGYNNIGKAVCSATESFDEFQVDKDSLGTITIPAGNTLIKEFDVLFPVGIQGEQKGCILYNMVGKENQTNKEENSINGGIKFIVSKGFRMNFIVGSTDDIQNNLIVNNFKTKLNDNKELIINFDITNSGNLENEINISGTITNILGYNKDFEIIEGRVAPERTMPVEANLGLIPSYGGLFNINLNINGTPYFSFDISESQINKKLLEIKTINAKTSFFKMPRLMLGGLALVILLLFLAFRKPKQKVVYVQQPQQPTPTIQ